MKLTAAPDAEVGHHGVASAFLDVEVVFGQVVADVEAWECRVVVADIENTGFIGLIGAGCPVARFHGPAAGIQARAVISS